MDKHIKEGFDNLFAMLESLQTDLKKLWKFITRG